MLYYDIVLDSFEFNDEFSKKLGFKHIYRINNNAIKDNLLCKGADTNELISKIRKGARAVIIDDFTLDRKLIAEMHDKESILVIPISSILSKNGFALTRSIYKVGILLKYVQRKNICISVCSYADSLFFMNSKVQLQVLSSMLGVSDKDVKTYICENNKKLGEIIGKN